ncbi:hypothetical protein KBD34_03245 [Patescibacteria group bacterium]|nr:hypothetical protein [Patescibacteria group bacterium]
MISHEVSMVLSFYGSSLARALARLAEKRDLPPEAFYFAASRAGRGLRRQMMDLIYDAYVVRVPDVSAGELLRLFREDNQDKAYVDDLEGWDFYLKRPVPGEGEYMIGGRGRSYEWRLWTPGYRVRGEDAAVHAARDGWFGHTAAFIQWRRINRTNGLFASVPIDPRDCMSDGHRSFVAYSGGFDNDSHGRNVLLGIQNRALEMRERTTFVEFREAKR